MIIGFVQTLDKHAFFNVLLPPLLGWSKQYLHVSQSFAVHPSQIPHLFFLPPLLFLLAVLLPIDDNDVDDDDDFDTLISVEK